MSLRLIFTPAAKAEFLEAIARYEGQHPGLGRDFAREVGRVLKRARAHPERFRRVKGRARKLRLKRFRAYSIYFAVKEDAFSVLAVFHGARNPRELGKRLSR